MSRGVTFSWGVLVDDDDLIPDYDDWATDDEFDGEPGELRPEVFADLQKHLKEAVMAGAVTDYIVECGEEFYGMGDLMTCTKAYGHEGDCSTSWS